MRGRAAFLAVMLAAAASPAQTPEEARALQKKGALREAEEAWESILPGLRKSDPAGAGAALNALGQIAAARGDYQSAAARAAEAVRLCRNAGDRAGESSALNTAGSAAIYRGEYGAALASFRAALALAREGSDAEGEVDELNNIGSVHSLQANYLEAARSYRAALDRLGSASGQAWVERKRALTVANLASLLQRLGQDDQAMQLYANLRNTSAALGTSEEARVLTNLGVLYRRLGDPYKALDTYDAARALLGREEHSDARIKVMKNIGIVQVLDLDDLPRALETFSAALSLAEKSGNRREVMQAHLYRGEVLFRSGDREAARRDYDAALAASAALGTTEEKWKALHGLGRVLRAAGDVEGAAARFAEAVQVIESVRARAQLPALKTDFLADRRDAYDALIELELSRASPGRLFDLFERSRARAFQDALAQGPASLAAVQARLDAKTLVLEFWMGPRSAAVLWATSDASGIVPLAVSSEDVERWVAQLSGERPDWTEAAASGGEALLGTLSPLAGNRIHHLVIVPDGALASLPFEALAPGGGPLVLERMDVSYVPAAALLLRGNSRGSRWLLPWQRQLVVFADPQLGRFPTAADDVGAADLPSALPASAEEARAIALAARGRVELFLGARNLKRHLLDGAVARASLLHLATHAVADPGAPDRSRILFTPERPGDVADYLFVKELSALDLRGVDLATLSACDTERGKLVRGEGINGFGRALLAAGSRAAVTTLWRVGDEPARELMKQFYFELGRAESKAQALRAAKLRLSRSGTALQHPRYWAPFVLSGEGLVPVPAVLPWSAVLVVAAAIVLGASFLVRAARACAVPGGGAAQHRGCHSTAESRTS